MTPDLENQIDAVGRRLTAGAPSPALRGRVAARLDERRPRPWLWLGGALAVAASAGSFVMIIPHRPEAPGARAFAPAAAVATDVTKPVPVDFRRVSTAADASEKAQASSPMPQAVEPSLTSDEIAWRERAVPPLLALPVVTVEGIQPEPLEVRPLVTTELTVPVITDDDNDGR